MPASKKSPSSVDKIVEAIKDCDDHKHHHHHYRGPRPGNAVYGMGILGAAIYYFQHPPADLLTTIFKVIFWPAVVAYRLLENFPF